MRLYRTAVVFVRLAALLLMISSCDESLPNYMEPDRVLEGKIEGTYVLGVTENVLKVYLTVKNVFDETLQGQGVLRGMVELISKRDPQVRKTIALSVADLISAPGYDSRTGELTFDAGSSIYFAISWDFTADDRGIDVRKEFFRYVRDPDCAGIERCLAYPEDFILRGEVELYNQRAPASVQGVYSLCFVSRWVNPKYCPQVITTPCTAPPYQVPECVPLDFSSIP